MGAIPEMMVSNSNITPWHRQGIVIDRYLTGNEAYTLAQLDYEVSKMGLYDMAGRTVDGRYVLVTDKGHVGKQPQIVADRYEIIQNTELADIVDGLGLNVQTAGTMWNRSFAWMLADLGESPMFDGTDEAIHRFLLVGAHHGTGTFQIAGVPVRVVCENTLQMALVAGDMMHSIRHTKNASGQLSAAKRSLDRTFAAFDDFDKAAHRMMESSFTDDEFRAMTNHIVPRVEAQYDHWNKCLNTRAFNASINKRMGVFNVWCGNTLTNNGQKTKWHALQAFNEYELHENGHNKNRDVRNMGNFIKGNLPLTKAAEKYLIGA